MAKYEIMLILAPGENTDLASNLASEVFGKESIKKSEKLEQTELAYPINKSKTATFFLMNVEAEESTVAEFNRRVNITKTLWRSLVINLDTETGLNRKASKRKEKFAKKFPPRPFGNNQDGNQSQRPYVRRDTREQTVKTADIKKPVTKSE